jgi:hypothetical protein
MTDREHECGLKTVPWALYGLAGAVAVAFIVALAAFASPRPASALPAYAQQTKLACGRCHVNPAGGGARNAFGNAFAANDHKLPSAKSSEKKTASGGGSSSTPPTAGSSPAVSVGGSPSDSDYAQAQAWSLRQPYYSHFLYLEK